MSTESIKKLLESPYGKELVVWLDLEVSKLGSIPNDLPSDPVALSVAVLGRKEAHSKLLEILKDLLSSDNSVTIPTNPKEYTVE